MPSWAAMLSTGILRHASDHIQNQVLDLWPNTPFYKLQFITGRRVSVYFTNEEMLATRNTAQPRGAFQREVSVISRLVVFGDSLPRKVAPWLPCAWRR